MRLADVMTDEVFFLTPTDSVQQAAAAMRDLNVGIVPICDDEQRLLAVVTDRDLALRVLAEGKDGSTPLDEVASVSVNRTEQSASCVAVNLRNAR